MPSRSTSERSQILSSSFQFLSGTVSAQLLGLVRSIMMPVLFNPSQLGVWNLMGVILNYGENSHLGIQHGMNKLVPVLRGQGKNEEVEVLRDSVFWTTIILGLIWFSLIWGISYTLRASYSPALRITAGIIFLASTYGYFFSLLRADNRFKLISAALVGFSILSSIFVLTLGFISTDHLSGALVGLLIAYALTLVFFFKRSRYRFAFQISGKAVSKSFAAGIPILTICILLSAFISIDRWMIASYLGTTPLGYYAIAVMASGMIGLIPGSISSVLYPRMLERFGRHGDPVALKGLVIGPTLGILAFMSILIGSLNIVLPFVITFFLPKYLSSIPLLIILTAASYFYSASSVGGMFLVAINKQILSIRILAALLLVTLGLDYFVIKMGWGIIGIAYSTAISYAIYGCGIMGTAICLATGGKHGIFKFFAEAFVVFFAMILGVYSANWFVPGGDTVGAAFGFLVVRLALFLIALSSVLFFLLNRNGELSAIIINEFRLLRANDRQTSGCPIK